MGLNSCQTQLLRYFSLAKMTLVKEAVEALEHIYSAEKVNTSCNADELTNQIDSINRVIRKYDLEILEGVEEKDGEKIFALVNTADNHVTQKAKFYDSSTVQLFSKIVQACVMSESGKLSEIACINLNTLCEMSKTAAQNAIHRLVKDKWLISEDGVVTLTMRSILELESSIRQQYPDHVKNCPLCKIVLIQGSICGDCRCKIHFFCLKKFFQKKSKNCPSCNSPWNELENPDQNTTASSIEENDNDTEPEVSQFETTQNTSNPDPTPAKRKRRVRSQKYGID